MKLIVQKKPVDTNVIKMFLGGLISYYIIYSMSSHNNNLW